MRIEARVAVRGSGRSHRIEQGYLRPDTPEHTGIIKRFTLKQECVRQKPFTGLDHAPSNTTNYIYASITWCPYPVLGSTEAAEHQIYQPPRVP